MSRMQDPVSERQNSMEIGPAIKLSLPRYIEFLQILLRIPTPRMREHECMRFLGRALEHSGVKVDYFEGEGLGEPTPDGPPLNLIARRQGSGGGKSLLVQAHMDTVPPGDECRWVDGPWSGRIADGRIYARGAHDDRVGAAMIWMVADLLSQLEIRTRGDLYLLVTTEEEYSSGGMRAYAKRPESVRPDAHLAIDGNQTHYCMAGHAGALTFEVTIEGKWGSIFHQQPDLETNPINLAAILVAQLEGFQEQVRTRFAAMPHDPRWWEPLVAVTEIVSSGWFSNVPERCVVRGFGNVLPPMGLDEYKRLFEEFVGSWAAGFAWLRERPPTVSWGPVEVPSSVISEDSEFYRMLAACHEEHFRMPLRPRYTGGWGDMVLLGCPNLIFYGPGAGGGDHSYNEYFELADLGPILNVLLTLTVRWTS
jgi:acetylornithine deacetylase